MTKSKKNSLTLTSGNDAMTKPKKSHLKLTSGNYTIDPTGVWLESPKSDNYRICGSLKLINNRVHLGSNVITVGVNYIDCNGAVNTIDVPRSEVLNPRKLIDRLSDFGLEVLNKKATEIYLECRFREKPPKKFVLMTYKPGWNIIDADSNDSLIYASNHGNYKPSNSEHNVVLADGIDAGFSSSGDLAAWNEKVAQYCIANPWLQFAVCIQLASLILPFSGLPNFGFHFFGHSKTGKTTALILASSVVSNANYVLNWNATTNALEVIAVSRNDSALILDEIGQGDPKAVSKAVYNLMNGRVKSRLGSDIKLNSDSLIRVIVLSSGEHDLRTHLKNAGIEVKPGQLARLISVPVFSKNGVSHNLHEHANRSALAATIIKNASESYGTLGPAFLEYVADNQPKLKKSTPKNVTNIAHDLLDSLDDIPDQGTFNSIANSFALVAVAGELAIKIGLLAWEKNDAITAVTRCFKAWAKNEQKFSAISDNDVFKHLSRFFQSERAGKFVPMSEFECSSNSTLAGYDDHRVDGNEVFLVYPAYFETVLCKQFGKQAAIRVLKAHELLILGGHNTPTRQINIPKSKQKEGQEKLGFYVISQAILRG